MSTAAKVARPMSDGRREEDWTILRLMSWSGEYLRSKGVDRGRLDAEHLLAHVLDLGRLDLYLQFDRPLTEEELDRFRPLLKRRASREPLQYILGRQAFRELDLEVGPGVLIPRPETELLVDAVLEWAAAEERRELRALDVGTGSGAIALALAHEGPFATVVASDVSPSALELCARNRDRAGLTERVELRLGPGFDVVEDGERFDVVVSNPPYVAEAEAHTLEPEVGAWEPAEALFGGPDGLSALRSLVADAGEHVPGGGLLALEVGAGQAEHVSGMCAQSGAWKDIVIKRDYAGIERIVLAERIGRL